MFCLVDMFKALFYLQKHASMPRADLTYWFDADKKYYVLFFAPLLNKRNGGFCLRSC